MSDVHPTYAETKPERRWKGLVQALWTKLYQEAESTRGTWCWRILPNGIVVALQRIPLGSTARYELRFARRSVAGDPETAEGWATDLSAVLRVLKVTVTDGDQLAAPVPFACWMKVEETEEQWKHVAPGHVASTGRGPARQGSLLGVQGRGHNDRRRLVPVRWRAWPKVFRSREREGRMKTSMEVPKVLRRAADLIEVDGWWQLPCQRYRPATKRCVMIAIADAYPGNGNLAIAIRANTSRAIKEYLGIIDVFRWNDDPERTSEEVVDTLRVVAALHDTTYRRR